MSSLHTVSIPTSLSLPDSRVVARSFPYPIAAVTPHSRTDSSVNFSQVITMVLWSGCLLVGVVGYALPYSRPRAPALPPELVVIEKLTVDLVNDPLPPAALPSDPLSTPPPPAALVQPQIAQAVAVAEPSPVAFALPVEGPTIPVAADQATHARPAIVATSAVVGSPALQTLVFGQGEGRQPPPEYPARSVKLGQEGTVDIRLTVDPSGQVTDTAVATPCAWPLLNDAAERTVRLGAGRGPGGQGQRAAGESAAAPQIVAQPLSSDQKANPVGGVPSPREASTANPPARSEGGERRSGEGRPTAQAISITGKEPGSWPRIATITLSLNPYTGEILKREGFADLAKSRQIRTWTRFLHTGQAIGWIGQLAAGLACLGGCGLVYTGFALAWRRFFGKKSKTITATHGA